MRTTPLHAEFNGHAPTSVDSADLTLRVSTSPKGPDTDGDRKVCIIDDDDSIRRALRRLLRSLGFVVEAFASTEEFLAAKDSSPDCLVLDIHLGGLSTFEFYAGLRSEGLPIPVVVVTGDDDPVIREQARRLGVAGFVLKPFGDVELVSAIETAIARARG